MKKIENLHVYVLEDAQQLALQQWSKRELVMMMFGKRLWSY
ncbi:MAG: hypothetical protein ABFS56_15005 [Pseudomonadota bacterium]